MIGERFTLVACVNNTTVLNDNLLQSPELVLRDPQILLQQNFVAATRAYNEALDRAAHDLVVFVHQDVYLPDGWFASLEKAIGSLERCGITWGVLGCYGVKQVSSENLGRIFTTGIGRHGCMLAEPEPIDTLDEIVLVMRKSSGLRFDEQLPHFHMYGTDLCMTAAEKGLVNYAFQGYCVHNTNQILILPKEFYECYRYVRRKWAHRLPIRTSCINITLLNGDFHIRRLIEAKQKLFGMRSRPSKRLADPTVFQDLIDAGVAVQSGIASANRSQA
jgi:hypothetical protein